MWRHILNFELKLGLKKTSLIIYFLVLFSLAFLIVNILGGAFTGARIIIGNANNNVNAPIIVDTENDEVYYTPLYYVMSHFSKFIRPGAEIIEVEKTDPELMVTAAINEDGSKVLVIFNESNSNKSFQLFEKNSKLTDQRISISPRAIQTIKIDG